VTDEGSLSIICPASFGCGADRSAPAQGTGGALLPRGPDTGLKLWLRCRICGRSGRFVDPFPRIPRRR
jgi:hypothetical protein